jgi:hypothetical protein
MPKYALVFGSVLVLLGIGGFAGTGARSVTALIPAFAGVLFLILGIIAQKGSSQARRHAMHGAVILALLGFAGAGRGLVGLAILLGGGNVQRPVAVVMQSAMALVCAAFFGLGMRSFLSARGQRSQGED